MQERLKELRKALALTQQEFADKLQISRSNIGSYEAGKNQLSDAVIRLIVKIFYVNEDWLRTGRGPMFLPRERDEQIMDFVASAMSGESDNFKRRLLSVLARLDEDHWELLERYLRELVAPPEAPTDNTEDGP